MRRHPSLIPLSHDHRDALGLAFFLHHPVPPGRPSPMTPPSTPSGRRERTLGFFEAHLSPHFVAEESVLFPALITQQALVATLVAEHRRLESLRDALALADGDEAIDTILLAFADLLEAHVRMEERDLFAAFPGTLSEPVVADIGAGIARALAQTRRR